MPSLEGWPNKAKEAPSHYELRLTLLDTNPVFQCLCLGSFSQCLVTTLWDFFLSCLCRKISSIIFLVTTNVQINSLHLTVIISVYLSSRVLCFPTYSIFALLVANGLSVNRHVCWCRHQWQIGFQGIGVLHFLFLQEVVSLSSILTHESIWRLIKLSGNHHPTHTYHLLG